MHILSVKKYGSRSVVSEENCPQTLTLTGGQYSLGTIVQTPEIT